MEQTRQRLIARFYRFWNRSFTAKALGKFRRAVLEGVLPMPAIALRRVPLHTRQSGFRVECRKGDTLLVMVVDTSTLASRNPAITEALAQAAIRALEDGASRTTEAVVKIAIHETRGNLELEFTDSQIIVRASRLEAMTRAYERAIASCDSNSTVAYLAKRKLMAQLEDVLFWESEKLPLTRSETDDLGRR